MGVIYFITTLIFMVAGAYSLMANQPFFAIHYLLIALHVHTSMYELRGEPFPRPLYLTVALLLGLDAFVQLFLFEPTNLLGGIISLFLAFSSWQSAQRQRPSH